MQINLSKSQNEFINSTTPFTLFAGGLGSGKTFAGAAWVTRMILEYPGVTGVITANSYKQLQRATLVTLFQFWRNLGIKFKYLEKKGEITVMGSTIYAVSMDNFDDLRGFEVGWAWSDEAAFYKKEAYQVLIGRIRGKKGPLQWKGTTTPNGFNYLWEIFVEGADESTLLVRSRTTENASNLGEQYVKSLGKQYDKQLAKQEMDGEFVNLNSGSVYYTFNRKEHVKDVGTINHALLYVGLDFNVHPLCGVFVYAVGDKLFVKEELYLENSNTFQAAKEIIKRYPIEPLSVICDETGNRRKSSSNTTDHEILRRANLPLEKFRNPFVKDRYNNLNRLFEQGRIIIDPSCKYLIKDLEQLVYDNKDDMLSHISDALGYVAWFIDPLEAPKRRGSVTYR
ncbi:terminase family protein [Candidatus Pacearchaeota archaeon]|nr:terminase family protein [Candidatus Pacearchaeota archaeon]